MKNPDFFPTAARSGSYAGAAMSAAPVEPQPAAPPRQNQLPPLARLVRERLADLGLRQAEFCRKCQFDQGLLSKLQNGMITNLSLESVLRLAVGLEVPPRQILTLINRLDLHDLIFQAYGPELTKESADTQQQ